MSISTVIWLIIMLNLTGTGLLETAAGLTVKQQLLVLPPHSVTRYKSVPGPNNATDRPRYRIYNVKQP